MTREITFLDLTTGTERTGQFWSDAPLITGRHAVWVVAADTGRPCISTAGRTAPEHPARAERAQHVGVRDGRTEPARHPVRPRRALSREHATEPARASHR
jgi:hypothetical protein